MATAALPLPFASEVAEGTYEMTGTIVSVSWRSRSRDRKWGTWSRRPHVGMMVALDAPHSGVEVWGTVPRSVERGLIERLYERRDSCINYAELVEAVPVRVRFTATLKPSNDGGRADGFFKWPRNAVLLD
jgi:hypothetical protein